MKLACDLATGMALALFLQVDGPARLVFIGAGAFAASIRLADWFGFEL